MRHLVEFHCRRGSIVLVGDVDVGDASGHVRVLRQFVGVAGVEEGVSAICRGKGFGAVVSEVCGQRTAQRGGQGYCSRSGDNADDFLAVGGALAIVTKVHQVVGHGRSQLLQVGLNNCG